MSSDLSPDFGPAPLPTIGDNRYKTVQTKLRRLAARLDDAAQELDALRRSMHTNADRADGVARDIDEAGLDPKYVETTSNVSLALGGAATQARKLHETTLETADLTHQTVQAHCRLYGELDDIRSTRRERTPKPGFFAR